MFSHRYQCSEVAALVPLYIGTDYCQRVQGNLCSWIIGLADTDEQWNVS